MPHTPQVHVVAAIALSAQPNEDATTDITLVLGDGTPALDAGDHLHVILSRPQLESLSRHIEHARGQLPGASARRRESQS